MNVEFRMRFGAVRLKGMKNGKANVDSVEF